MLFPADPDRLSLPVRQQLARHTDTPGLVGEVARVLHGNDWPPFLVALKGELVTLASSLLLAGSDVCFPIVASLNPPPDGMWLEVEDGIERFGLLASRLNGLIRVRHVEVWPDRPPVCRLLSVAMRRYVDKPRIDWEAVRRGNWRPSPTLARKWTAWCLRHLVTEVLADDLTADEGEYAKARMQGVHDLLLLALACSPLVLDRIRRAVA